MQNAQIKFATGVLYAVAGIIVLIFGFFIALYILVRGIPHIG